jgi:hypothetical protein
MVCLGWGSEIVIIRKTHTILDALRAAKQINDRVFALYFINGSYYEERDTKYQPTIEIGSYNLQAHSPKNSFSAVFNVDESSGLWRVPLSRSFLDNTSYTYEVDSNGFYGVFSTEQEVIYAPTSAFQAIYRSLKDTFQLNCEISGFSLIICKNTANLPGFGFSTPDGDISISSNSLWYLYEGESALLIARHDSPDWIIGNAFIRAFYMVFDVDNMTISLAQSKSTT